MTMTAMTMMAMTAMTMMAIYGNDDDGNDDALGLRAPRPPRTLRTSNFCVLPPFAADMGYCMHRRGVRACV